MKVILLQDIYKHGVAGEVVNVADGFARNYLIPRRMAIQATNNALKQHERLREQVEMRRAAYENKLNELAKQIDGTELFFERRAAVTGKLFGSVTAQEITEALNEKTGIDINRRRISQQGLRELGVHHVPVRLGSENPPMLVCHVVREGEMKEYLAKLAAGAAAAEEAALEAATEVLPRAAVQEALDAAAAEAAEAE